MIFPLYVKIVWVGGWVGGGGAEWLMSCSFCREVVTTVALITYLSERLYSLVVGRLQLFITQFATDTCKHDHSPSQ